MVSNMAVIRVPSGSQMRCVSLAAGVSLPETFGCAGATNTWQPQKSAANFLASSRPRARLFSLFSFAGHVVPSTTSV
jgi:hypothetical protein